MDIIPFFIFESVNTKPVQCNLIGNLKIKSKKINKNEYHMQFMLDMIMR